MDRVLNDVPDACFIIMDLEWIGNSFKPLETHLTDIACYNPKSNASFVAQVQPFAPSTDNRAATRVSAALDDLLAWLQEQTQEKLVLIAHNGIRFDGPVLLHALRRCGKNVPANVCVMDSLYHLRHHLRYRVPKDMRYDIDSLCAYFNIPIDVQRRHSAAYDVFLLHSILQHVQLQGIPMISGRQQPLAQLSTMLVYGIGPAVCLLLPHHDLLSLCEHILTQHSDLSKESCTRYFEGLQLQEKLPLCNISLIAANVDSAAKTHLQYLETGT